MKTVLLASLCSYLRSGGTPKSDNPDFYGGDIPFVTIEDMTAVSKSIKRTEKSLTQTGLDNSNCWLVPKGALVYSIYATLGVSRLLEIPAATNQAILGIVPNAKVADAEFLHYCLAALEQQISRFAGHTTQSNLSSAIVKALPIPDFPKPQQEGIARLLAFIDRAIEQTEALLAKQQRIKTGLMHDLLTRGIDAQDRLRDPSTHRFKVSVLGPIPEEWSVRPLADIVPAQRPIVYGILMPGEYVERGVPVIKVRDIQNGFILTKGLLRTHPKIDAAFARSRLQTGDLLFTIRGSVGRMAVVPPELDRANITQDTARITVSEGNTSFVRHCLEMPSQRAVIELHTIGQAVKGINLGEVRKIPIQFPEPDEQTEIARRLDAHDRDLAATKIHLGKLRRLKSGLMHDLLTGRVPVTPLLTHPKPPISS